MSISRTNDVLKVSNATRKAVNTRDHQHVTGSQEVQHSAQLIAPCGGCALASRNGSSRSGFPYCATGRLPLLEPPTKGSVPSKRISHDVTAWLGLMLRRLFRTCDFQGARNGP